jgi:hypothetical protein
MTMGTLGLGFPGLGGMTPPMGKPRKPVKTGGMKKSAKLKPMSGLPGLAPTPKGLKGPAL